MSCLSAHLSSIFQQSHTTVLNPWLLSISCSIIQYVDAVVTCGPALGLVASGPLPLPLLVCCLYILLCSLVSQWLNFSQFWVSLSGQSSQLGSFCHHLSACHSPVTPTQLLTSSVRNFSLSFSFWNQKKKHHWKYYLPDLWKINYILYCHCVHISTLLILA